MRILVATSLLLLSSGLYVGLAQAKSPALIGAWHGGGVISTSYGSQERTKCSARIKKTRRKGRFKAKYKCTSPVGLITQSVTLRRLGKGRYSGSFHNQDYDIRGRISVTLKGHRQSVTMRSSDGNGWFKLKKR